MTSERTIPHLRDVFGLSGYASSAHLASNGHHHRQPDYYSNSSGTNDVDYARFHPQQQQQQAIISTGPQYAHHQQQQQQQSYQHHQQQPQQHQQQPETPLAVRQPTRKTRRGDNYKTLTPGDVKTLERHLSMKKTIRKKIMRDLQQAFVDDPNEFVGDPHASQTAGGNQRLRGAELNMEALRFGGDGHHLTQSDNFLVMLRDEHQQLGGGMRHHHGIGAVNNNTAAYGQQQQQMSRMSPASREYDYDAVAPASAASVASPSTSSSSSSAPTAAGSGGREEKPSFWKRLTMKNKSSKR